MTTMTTRNETQIAADPALPTIVITREFGMEGGLTEGYQRLDELLAAQA